MEWVETTAKTIEEAREAALDQLGVGADEAEFDVLEEPKPGLFGRTRGQARIRARIMPSPARAKQERRRKPKGDKPRGQSAAGKKQPDKASKESNDAPTEAASADSSEQDSATSTSEPKTRSRGNSRSGTSQEKKMSNEERPQSDVTPQEVGDAAVLFMNDLVSAFGGTGTAELTVDGIELDVQVHGEDLGLLVGPGGRTLNAVQDLVRVAAQRRLGDHETRLRIDVAGYRERRSAALSKFAAEVAGQVRESGSARSLEPMTSADRKVIHDALNDEDGVVSTSSGEDPYRRVVVEPA
ncbi:MAG: spoIIIJ-associated protein [Candidatus Azotimanducaceae bacterium]|jgi:spoIIIJ-associated protein|tara:strand:+ start:8149 stop:9039 length:891 start_codon:yes stop_codon:yes gene_type:complete